MKKGNQKKPKDRSGRNHRSLLLHSRPSNRCEARSFDYPPPAIPDFQQPAWHRLL